MPALSLPSPAASKLPRVRGARLDNVTILAALAALDDGLTLRSPLDGLVQTVAAWREQYFLDVINPVRVTVRAVADKADPARQHFQIACGAGVILREDERAAGRRYPAIYPNTTAGAARQRRERRERDAVRQALGLTALENTL